MDWTTVMNMIDPKLIIVVVACWIVGFVLKQTPMVPDWQIIYYVSVFSLIFTVWMVGLSASAIIQGIFCAAVAVYGNQFVKQAKKGADGQ